MRAPTGTTNGTTQENMEVGRDEYLTVRATQEIPICRSRVVKSEGCRVRIFFVKRVPVGTVDVKAGEQLA